MKAVQLCCASNVISRKDGGPHQELSFWIYVANHAPHKVVEVRWAGESGEWHTSPARFVASIPLNRELWVARGSVPASAETSLPGNVRFAIRAQMGGREFWDSRSGVDYRIEADCGVRLWNDVPVALVGFEPRLDPGQRVLPVTVAVSGQPGEVFAAWSLDSWKHSHHTPLRFSRNLWDREATSNARNPNQYGVSVHRGRIKIGAASRVELAVGCSTAFGDLWDNNLGANYVFHRGGLKVLTLNLHCYQEENQDAKLALIARAIRELDVDLVCLQEVAEDWNAGQGDWRTNAVRIILERLPCAWHVYTDWSHRGFDRYREGVAVLSRHPFTATDARYVSTSEDPYDIHARKVVMVQVDVPAVGMVNLYSAHLSWWSGGFRQQWDNLAAWANHRHAHDLAGTLLCGDFNVEVGSEGYRHLVETSDFEDQVLKLQDPQGFDAAFGAREKGWGARLGEGGRIDYVFLKRGSRLVARSARAVFTEQDYGRVSDHEGYLLEFELG